MKTISYRGVLYVEADDKKGPPEKTIQMKQDPVTLTNGIGYQFIKLILNKLAKDFGGEVVSSNGEAMVSIPVKSGEVLLSPIKTDDGPVLKIEMYFTQENKAEMRVRELGIVKLEQESYNKIKADAKKLVEKGKRA